MATENASYISELNASYPADGDAVGEGGGTTTGTGSTRGHLNMIKYALKTQFSGLSGTTAVTASEAEMNYLDIATLGTSEASKVVTADANGDVTIADGAYDFDVASHDGTNGLKLAGTLVTATAAEMNYLDITTLGTSANSKALTQNASGEITIGTGSVSTGVTRGVPITITQGTDIDLDTGNNFLWTPAAADVLSFTNETTGQSGFIKVINPSAYALSLGTNVKAISAFATNISVAGTYLVTYFCDGTDTYLSASGILV
jgi:predicted extracellular nuclease